MKPLYLAALACVLGVAAGSEPPTNWNQFRGPDASGLAGDQNPPIEFGRDSNLLWRVEVPIGHSSPVIWGNRLFLTAFDADKQQLQALCLDRETGALLWSRTIESEGIEKVHAVSNPAASTAAVDADSVYVYFGSFGVVAYDHEGTRRWEYRLPVAELIQGSGVSPVAIGDRVILNREDQKQRFLIALDRRSGNKLWKTEHLPVTERYLRESYATPVVHESTIYLHHGGEIAAFSLEDGRRLWWFRIATTGTSTPIAIGDALYVAAYIPAGEPSHRVKIPSFDALQSRADGNGDGRISKEEMPDDIYLVRRPEISDAPGATVTAKRFFEAFDSDKNGALDRKEWDGLRDWVAGITEDHGFVKLSLGGTGDVTESHLLWRERTAIPEAPSPLVTGERAYIVKNGGIVTCLDAASGERRYRARLGATGPYYSSPVAVGGRIYVASQKGVIVVFKDADELDVLARNEIGEPIFATPAIVDDTVYVRTESALYAFAE